MLPPNATVEFEVVLLAWGERDLTEGAGKVMYKVLEHERSWEAPKDKDEVRSLFLACTTTPRDDWATVSSTTDRYSGFSLSDLSGYYMLISLYLASILLHSHEPILAHIVFERGLVHRHIV